MPIPEFDPEAMELGEAMGEVFWVYQRFNAGVILPEQKDITAEGLLKKVEKYFRHESQSKDFSEGFLARYEVMEELNE